MEKISFKNLDGWLKSLVVIGWISIGFTILSLVAAILSILSEIATI